MQSIKINSKSQLGIAWLSVLILITLIVVLLIPLITQADENFDTLLELAKNGDADAQFKVGEMYEYGLGVKQNKREALYWTTRSANQKHETAGFKQLYWELEKKGLQGKNITRLEELNSQAKQGNAQAQYYLGKIYANGAGIKKDPEVAADWLNKAAEAGVLEAEIELSSIQQSVESKPQKDKKFKPDICNSKSAKFMSICR